MEQNYQRDLSVEEIADVCKLNRSYFGKLFKERKGCPPQEFLIRMRLSKAAELMKTSSASIGDIAVACGYPNQLHFSRSFKHITASPPGSGAARTSCMRSIDQAGGKSGGFSSGPVLFRLQMEPEGLIVAREYGQRTAHLASTYLFGLLFSGRPLRDTIKPAQLLAVAKPLRAVLVALCYYGLPRVPCPAPKGDCHFPL